MKLRWITIAVLLLMLLPGPNYVMAAPLANDITCSASLASIYQAEETTDVTVSLAALSGSLYGYQLIVGFDADKLQAQPPSTPGTAFGTIITCGSSGCSDAWNVVINNTAGTVKFARTQNNPGPAASGPGSLAVVRFKAKDDAITGATPITLSEIKLADRDGNALTVGGQGCTSLTIKGKGFVAGSVDLQGRPDPAPSVSDDSDVTLTITGTVGVQPPDLYPPLGIQSVATGAIGVWGPQKAAAGSYAGVTIRASMARYLDLTCTMTTPLVIGPDGATTTLKPVTLPGGDALEDNKIDVSDATIIGGEFGETPPTDVRADINNDGTVDIFDLVLMGGNYTVGDTSPLPTWTCQ